MKMNVWHFDSPKRPFLCSDLSKESSSVDRYQLRNIYCYIFLQLDNAMIYMLYRKSWLKWVCRVYTWSTFKASVSPQKLAKNQQSSLKTLSCVLYKNTDKYRYLIFKNPGTPIFSGIPQEPDVGHHQVLHMNLSCKHIHFHFEFCR